MTDRLKSYINQTLRPAYNLSSDYEVLEGNPIWIVPIEGRSELSYLLQNANFNEILQQIFGDFPASGKIEYYDEAIHVFLPSSEFIEGPISLSEHIGKGKHIYLFGEQHFDKKNCEGNFRKVQDLFKEIVEHNPNRTIDLFLEVAYLTEGISMPEIGTSDIAGIVQTFQDCFSYDKSKCSYPNLRAHYTDMRLSILGIEPTEFSEIISKLFRDPDNIKAWEKVLEILGTDNTDLFYLLTTQSDVNGKLAKQLQETDPEVAEILISYYRSQIKLDLPVFIRQVTEYLGVLKRGYVRVSTSRELVISLISWQSIILDLYLLARLFRSFQGNPAQNVLIYVGDAHAEMMRGFFKDLGLKEIQKVRSEKSCIDISGFKKPFF